MEKECAKILDKKYDAAYKSYLGDSKSKSKKEKADGFAKKNAIVETFHSMKKKYPQSDAVDIWNTIHRVYYAKICENKSLKFGSTVKLTAEIVEEISSVEQSWKSVSGYAFEKIITDFANPKLKKEGLELVSSTDLKKMIKDDSKKKDSDSRIIIGGDEFIKWLKDADVKYDLYLLQSIGKQNHKSIIGVVQSKTSVRERFSRDIPLSEKAIDDQKLWSVVIALNGEPVTPSSQYSLMVNGGGRNYYEKNGWHGMYVLAKTNNNDRIYLDGDLSVFVSHAKKVFKDRPNTIIDRDYRPF